MNRIVNTLYVAAGVIGCWSTCQRAGAVKATTMVELSCPDRLVGKADESLTIHCQLKNGSNEEIYILAAPLSLEGPQKKKPYLYVPTGWERYENVLQYGSPKSGLDIPTLFHPTVHLDFEQLSRLVILGKSEILSVDINWNPSIALDAVGGKRLAVQLKLIYLSKDRELVLLQGGLSEDCRETLTKVISRVRPTGNLKLEPFRGVRGKRWFYDGCRDKISESFSHLYSNLIVIESKSK
jgi:hypothetical protein